MNLSHLADLCHFCLVDVSVLVYIEQREGPLQLSDRLPSGGHVQGNDILLEVQSAIIVGVKGAKHMSCVALGVTVREETRVDLLKLLWCYASGWALLLKVLVPLADLSFSEFGAELEVL